MLQSTRLINYLLEFIKAIEPIIKTNELDIALKEHKYEQKVNVILRKK